MTEKLYFPETQLRNIRLLYVSISEVMGARRSGFALCETGVDRFKHNLATKIGLFPRPGLHVRRNRQL